MNADAQAIHAIDQGLAECREHKAYWQRVLHNTPRVGRWYGVLAIVNILCFLWGVYDRNWIWLNLANLAGAILMARLYLRIPQEVARAEHQIRVWKDLEREWLGFLYAVREGRPYEED